eukprot:5712753-Pyramimonas_sp.AAC.1
MQAVDSDAVPSVRIRCRQSIRMQYCQSGFDAGSRFGCSTVSQSIRCSQSIRMQSVNSDAVSQSVSQSIRMQNSHSVDAVSRISTLSAEHGTVLVAFSLDKGLARDAACLSTRHVDALRNACALALQRSARYVRVWARPARLWRGRCACVS